MRTHSSLSGLLGICSLSLLLPLLFPSSASGQDEIEKLSGQVLKGKILRESKSTVIITVVTRGGGEMMMAIPMKQVRAIIKDGRRRVVKHEVKKKPPAPKKAEAKTPRRRRRRGEQQQQPKPTVAPPPERAKAKEPKPVDPMPWTAPKERPALRGTLKPDVFQARFDAAVKKLRIEEWEASKAPIYRVRLIRIQANSQASRLGWQVGELIESIDGHSVGFEDEFTRWRKKDGSTQKFTIVGLNGKRREAAIQPGRIGIWYDPSWAPYLQFLRGKQRDKKWDLHLLVASRNYESDPALAEMALQRAAAKGYRQDPLSDTLAAWIAFSQGRSSDAMAFASFALRENPDNRPVAQVFRLAALRSYKLPEVVSILRKHPSLASGDIRPLERLIAAHQAKPKDERTVLRPSQRVETFEETDIIARATPLRQSWAGTIRKMVDTRSIVDIVKTDWFSNVPFRPAITNGIIDFTFRLKPTDEKNAEFQKKFSVALVDENDPKFVRFTMSGVVGGALAVKLYANGSIQLIHKEKSLRFYCFVPKIHMDYETENTFTMIVLEDQCEIIINGQTLFYGPRPSAGRMVPVFKSLGMTFAVTKLRVSELEKKRADPKVEGEDVF